MLLLWFEATHTHEVRAFATWKAGCPTTVTCTYWDSIGTGPKKNNLQKIMYANHGRFFMDGLESGIGRCMATATRQRHNVCTSVPEFPARCTLGECTMLCKVQVCVSHENNVAIVYGEMACTYYVDPQLRWLVKHKPSTKNTTLMCNCANNVLQKS